jgi:hypothetical protein
MKPTVVEGDFFEAESGFQVFDGRLGQSNTKKILAGAFGAVLHDEDGKISAVLFAHFDREPVDGFVKDYAEVEYDSCARCYKQYPVTDDGGLCLSCSK